MISDAISPTKTNVSFAGLIFGHQVILKKNVEEPANVLAEESMLLFKTTKGIKNLIKNPKMKSQSDC